MIRKTAAFTRTVFVLGIAATAPSYAGEFTLDWWTIDAGGAMGTIAGDFELSGTIGQRDAGGPLSGAGFELVGGFWPGSGTSGAELYALTVLIEGRGRVDLDPPGGTYAAGTTVQLTAIADPGWSFDHWEGALTGSRNPETLVMDADLTVTAVFTQEPCFGDLDGDGQIGLSDLAQLLSNYGETSGMTYEDGDLDEDGDVDPSDLAALLAVYGEPCP